MADAPVLTLPTEQDETERAQALARRYRSEFVDLKNFRIEHELFKSVPVDLMFRYNFVPLEQHEDRLVIAVSAPSRLMVMDEIAGLLGQRISTRVATLTQITDLLKKTEQSQRVLDEASEGMTFDVIDRRSARRSRGGRTAGRRRPRPPARSPPAPAAVRPAGRP